MVVLQHSTETRMQVDGADFLRMIAASFDQPVVDSLVVSFNVVVRHILGDHVPRMQRLWLPKTSSGPQNRGFERVREHLRLTIPGRQLRS